MFVTLSCVVLRCFRRLSRGGARVSRSPHPAWLPAVACCWIAFCGAAAASDVESGPAVGEKPPTLKIQAVTGDHAGKEIECIADRANKPTLYLFLPREKFSRPIARFLKKLDAELKTSQKEAAAIAVWISDDAEKSKEHLPKVQQSMAFENTSLGFVPTEPEGWGINGDAHVTAVVVQDGKTVGRFGFVSANETLAADVLKAFK